jgi:hypothetical protein
MKTAIQRLTSSGSTSARQLQTFFESSVTHRQGIVMISYEVYEFQSDEERNFFTNVVFKGIVINDIRKDCRVFKLSSSCDIASSLFL